MKIFANKKGFTLIELILTSAIITFILLGVINVLNKIYIGIVSMRAKTHAINLASETIEFLRHYGYAGLNITPDSCIGDNPFDDAYLTLLNNCNNNPYPVEIVNQEGRDFTIYKVVQYALPDSSGSIVAKKQSELHNEITNLKMMRVIITYTDNNIIKKHNLVSIISNKEMPLGGSTISGRVILKETGGSSMPPGQAAQAKVYVEGHPEYTAEVETVRGEYKIYNVLPGDYILYSEGIDGSFTRGYYPNNPIHVSDTPTDYTNINIICDKVNPATIIGLVVENGCNPPSIRTPLPNVVIKANDLTGLAPQVTASINTPYNFTIPNINAGTSGGGMNITLQLFSQNPPGNNLLTSVHVRKGDTTYLNCIQLTPTTGGTTSQQIIVKKVKDRISPIVGANVYLKATPVATYTDTTDGTGQATLVNVNPGTYEVSASKPYYKMESQPFITSVFLGTNSPITIYMYGVGSIGGTITNSITGDPIPNIKVRAISNYGSGIVVSEAFSNTTGSYLLQDVPEGNDIMVKPYLDNTIYKDGVVYPSAGYYNPVMVTLGGYVSGKNFSLIVQYKKISGEVNLESNVLKDGVIIIAMPSSNTHTPHSFSYNLTNYLKYQDNYIRMRFNSYGTIAKSNGSYEVFVPDGGTYNIYAYYNTVDFSYVNGQLTRTYTKYYKVVSNVNPGDTVNFTGSWTTY